MNEIDDKDKKILYLLDTNSRMTVTQIGKKVGLKKNVVSYRLKRLKQKGIIKKYYTYIDAYKLGYISFRFYLNYQYTNPKIENEIINYFVSNKHIWRVISIKERFDLGVTTWVKDTNEFYKFWSSTMEKFGEYFTDITFSACIQSYDYRYSFILDETLKKSDREEFELKGGGKRIEIEDIDRKILSLIAENSRMSLKEIGRRLSISSTMAAYRLKNLVKNGMIQAFRTDIDISKLGYQQFKVDIFLRKYKQRSSIIKYLRFNPYLLHIGTSSGVSDLELEFAVKKVDKIYEILEELIVRFPNVIKNYKYFNIVKVHKINYMPEI